MSSAMFVFRSDATLSDAQAPRCSLEYDVLPRLASRGACWAFVTDLPVVDIGTPERYALAQGGRLRR
jgi:NDP-sugar pyrophosphorylase family protein